MILRIIICCSLLLSTRCQKQPPPLPLPERICLTGYMTDVQQWVSGKGVLHPQDDLESAIDLSSNMDPVPLLQLKMTSMRRGRHVKYLSLARCHLTEVPTVFKFSTSNGLELAQTLTYLTFYGNNFADDTPSDVYEVSINATQPWEKTVDTPWLRQPTVVHWSIGLRETEFPQLKELDLRSCSIQVLDDNIFRGMPNLQALYLGENRINYIYAKAFVGLESLIHLDLTYNEPCDDAGHELPLIVESTSILAPLKKLASLDFSHSKLPQRLMFIFYYVSRRLTRLSLCESGLTGLHEEIFKNTSIRILDVSGNNGILDREKALYGLENTLQILYAKDTGLKTMDIFKNFGKLEVLDVSINEIAVVEPEVSETLKSLQILNLEKNRFIAWFKPVFRQFKCLKLLALKENNINLITDEMVEDIANIEYVALSRNFIVCNCHSRDFINIALRNENRVEHGQVTEKYKNTKTHESPILRHHKAFEYYNNWIAGRSRVSINCTDCYDDASEEEKANFLLLDYHPGVYTCLSVPESKSIEFLEVDACNRNARIDYDVVMQGNRNKLFILLTIPCFLAMLIFIYLFRRNLRYCIITVKNSTMLSLVHKGEFIDDTTIFHYDVFVSYCNEDRNWVLEQLLPHLESDCSISACLHERDFQVGSSILENIVSCMDRSRSIMLIISRRFLLSQWCQFEMHLAQHRLLETRREDLTLVLLEEIPRRMRPNTLHYLMLTKTYIVWPSDDNEKKIFWRRLKKTLVTLKQKQSALENVSLA